jgi:hypothetical protein
MRRSALSLLGLAGLALAPAALAFSLDVSTSLPGWTAAYGPNPDAPVLQGPAYGFDCGEPATCVSFTSNGYSTGSFLAGGSAADFMGQWQIYRRIQLPAGLSDLRLSFSIHGVDDRATVWFNQQPLFTAYRHDTAVTSFELTLPGTVAAGDYWLAVNVANNPVFLDGGPVPFQSEFDGSTVAMSGQISAVPEPHSWAQLLLGLIATGWFKRRAGRR